MAEGAPLLREYGLIAHRGFESLSLRHVVKYREGLQAVFFARFCVFSQPVLSDESSHDIYLIIFFNLACCISDLDYLA